MSAPATSGERDFDLIVLGGGSGGLAAAFRASHYGARVALLAEGPLGGTCVNVGCVPKKAMWLAAELAHKIGMAEQLGFELPPARLDWPAFITHRQRYIANIHASYVQRLDAAGVAVMPTRGVLAARDSVLTGEGVQLCAPQIVIATGGRPQRPSIPGAELAIDSDGFFALAAAPERVAIIGAGYVAVELAGVLQALGSRVELFVRGQRLIESFDADLTAQLVEDYRHAGIHTHFGHSVQAIERVDGDRLQLRDAAGRAGDGYDTVILATGRRPNSDGIGLDRVGLALDARGHILVDACQRSSVDGIHALGDVSALHFGESPALTPVAIAAARKLMDRLFGGVEDAKLDYADIATVVFAHPPLGRLGLTEAQAREMHGDAVRVYRAGFRPMLHALADSPQRSLFKLVCVGADEHVVGIHLLGEGADEILQGFAVAMRGGLRKRDLDDTVAIHPTSAEELVLMR